MSLKVDVFSQTDGNSKSTIFLYMHACMHATYVCAHALSQLGRHDFTLICVCNFGYMCA